MTKLVLDTNVWYEIGVGTRDPARLKVTGNAVAIPTSIMEIASPHAEERNDTWPQRRKAAAAILEHADEIADDTETHLAVLWGLHPADRGSIWHDVCEAVSRSESLDDALHGIVDRVRNVKISLNVPVIQEWRARNWTAFREDVINAIEQHAPGYNLARSEGRYTNLPKEKRAQFAADLHSPEVRQVFLLSTFFRSIPSSNGSDVGPTEEQVERAAVSLAPYIDAYVEYIYGCATSFAPQANDFGDCECFVYLQDDNKLVTREKRWSTIAKRMCPTHYFEE